MKKIIFTVLMCLVSYSAEALPPAFNASYDISMYGVTIGHMTASLTYPGNHYIYSKSSKASGLANFLSGDQITDNIEGVFQGQKMIPHIYYFSHESKHKYIKDDMLFQIGSDDNTLSLVTGQYENKHFELTIPAETIDRNTMELALANDISSGKKSLSYLVVNSGKLKRYTFDYSAYEKVTVPAGNYTCLKFTIQREETTRKTTLWLAKETNYIPVKIQHYEKGKTFVSNLTVFESSQIPAH